ncbi:MAG: HAD-IC family P-type ATPase [Candidatus Dependentiae bacterium]
MNQELDISLRALERLCKTNIKDGLSAAEARRRLETDGKNRLPDVKQETWTMVFLRQFQSPLIYMLLAAAIIIFFVGEDKLDAFIISGVLLFNAIVGTIQEGRTRSVLQSLKRFVKTTSIVIRDGKRVLLDDVDIVPGDVILLQEGQRIPADAYVFQSNALQLDEAILTGESRPVYKSPYVECAQGEQQDPANILYKGTYVLSGSGKAVVFATGSYTEVGKIHSGIEGLDTNMPLKREIDRLSYWLLLVVLGTCVVLFTIGLFAGQPLRELLVMLTALFICVVPEGLPVVMTLVLVTGVYRMAKQNVLVKHLQAVEGLGRADVIAVDKTGTLTRNELLVSKVLTHDDRYVVSGQGYYPEGDILLNNTKVEKVQFDAPLYSMAVAAGLLNSAEITYDELRHTFDIKGDPTEAAMYVFAKKAGFDQQLHDAYEKLYEIPFSPELQYHAGFFEHEGQGIMYVIGAPELLFSISEPVHKKDDGFLRDLLKDGLRVVAVASKAFDIDIFAPDMADDARFDVALSVLKNGPLTLHGLFGIQDSIRPEVPEMVEKAQDAGLQVIMATGDHKDTALYVAKEVGIFKPGNDTLTGTELNNLSDDEMLARLERTTVYARVMPQEKMRLIKLFHKENRIIAMTGDGINDAPALVAADLGIAMGGIGTEVAKKAADIILLDDSFATIIRAIEQGRHIFYTLKRVILYFFATNVGEVLIILFALLLNAFGYDFPLPLTAAQILWLNLVTDGFLDIALSMEPQEEGLLRKKWLQEKVHLVDWYMAAKMVFYAVPMAIGSIWIFFQYYQIDVRLARTMTLICMAMFQWFNAWNCRSENRSLLSIGFLTNRWLILATGFVLFLQFLLVYAPFMQYIFKTVPLSLDQWLLILGITAPIVLFDEMRKAIVRYIWPEG